MIELLAPAGSYESLVAAVNAGADAVYIGGSKFSARAYADNPDEDMLIKGIEYAHTFGVNVYMTVNTLLKENEIKGLFEYIKVYYNAGLDAVIVQDLGVLEFIKKHFPLLPIHASTQMTVTGRAGAVFLKNQGVVRVVPARELSLKEISDIDSVTDIEIECFVHGALCYSYSGQCLMSSLIGGRSGNRGRCAQTCRLPYDVYDGEKKLNKNNERNLLSCKDLCSLDILPDLVEAGVDSLKIEGRMKSPRYTSGAVSIWRKYLDLYLQNGREGYKVQKSDRKLLSDLFDRGGQTEGYYKEYNGKNMIAVFEKHDNKKINSEYFDYLDKTYVDAKRKLPVFGEIRIKEGENIKLILIADNLKKVCKAGCSRENTATVEICGEVPEKAKARAVTYDDIDKQIKKTGNTLFTFKNLNIDVDENLFVPLKMLNEIRREAFDKLKFEILKRYRRDDREIKVPEFSSSGFIKENKAKKYNNTKFNILCETIEQLKACADFAKNRKFIFDEISIESELLENREIEYLLGSIRKQTNSINLYMPHIFRDNAENFFNKRIGLIKRCNFDNFIIRSLEEIFYIKENITCNVGIILDYNIYAYNKSAVDFYKKNFDIKRMTYPIELNLYEIKQLDNAGNEMVVYGKFPMMVSAQCLKKTTKGCDHKKETLFLKDRKNNIMEVKTHCDFCYNTILNSKPLSVLGMEKDIQKTAPDILRIWFTTENSKEVKEILKKYIESFLKNANVENIADFTRGHLKRGIE